MTSNQVVAHGDQHNINAVPPFLLRLTPLSFLLSLRLSNYVSSSAPDGPGVANGVGSNPGRPHVLQHRQHERALSGLVARTNRGVVGD